MSFGKDNRLLFPKIKLRRELVQLINTILVVCTDIDDQVHSTAFSLKLTCDTYEGQRSQWN